MVPDVMHDLLERVLPKTTCLMLLHHITVKKHYTIYQLDYALRNFKYEPEEVKNRQSLIIIAHLKKNMQARVLLSCSS